MQYIGDGALWLVQRMLQDLSSAGCRMLPQPRPDGFDRGACPWGFIAPPALRLSKNNVSGLYAGTAFSAISLSTAGRAEETRYRKLVSNPMEHADRLEIFP